MTYPLSYAFSTLIKTKAIRELLKVLLKDHPNPKSLRQIAKEAKLNLNAVVHAYKRLEKTGLVINTGKRKRFQIVLNTEHPLFPEILSLLVKSSGIGYLLYKTFQKWEIKGLLVTHHFIFKTEEKNVPYLIFIGTPDVLTLTQTMEEIEKETGLSIPYTVISPEDFRQRIRLDDPFIMGILAKPHVFLIGNLGQLLGGKP